MPTTAHHSAAHLCRVQIPYRIVGTNISAGTLAIRTTLKRRECLCGPGVALLGRISPLRLLVTRDVQPFWQKIPESGTHRHRPTRILASSCTPVAQQLCLACHKQPTRAHHRLLLHMPSRLHGHLCSSPPCREMHHLQAAPASEVHFRLSTHVSPTPLPCLLRASAFTLSNLCFGIMHPVTTQACRQPGLSPSGALS